MNVLAIERAYSAPEFYGHPVRLFRPVASRPELLWVCAMDLAHAIGLSAYEAKPALQSALAGSSTLREARTPEGKVILANAYEAFCSVKRAENDDMLPAGAAETWGAFIEAQSAGWIFHEVEADDLHEFMIEAVTNSLWDARERVSRDAFRAHIEDHASGRVDPHATPDETHSGRGFAVSKGPLLAKWDTSEGGTPY